MGLFPLLVSLAIRYDGESGISADLFSTCSIYFPITACRLLTDGKCTSTLSAKITSRLLAQMCSCCIVQPDYPSAENIIRSPHIEPPGPPLHVNVQRTPFSSSPSASRWGPERGVAPSPPSRTRCRCVAYAQPKHFRKHHGNSTNRASDRASKLCKSVNSRCAEESTGPPLAHTHTHTVNLVPPSKKLHTPHTSPLSNHPVHIISPDRIP
jgi:hypothetical protein